MVTATQPRTEGGRGGAPAARRYARVGHVTDANQSGDRRRRRRRGGDWRARRGGLGELWARPDWSASACTSRGVAPCATCPAARRCTAAAARTRSPVLLCPQWSLLRTDRDHSACVPVTRTHAHVRRTVSSVVHTRRGRARAHIHITYESPDVQARGRVRRRRISFARRGQYSLAESPPPTNTRLVSTVQVPGNLTVYCRMVVVDNYIFFSLDRSVSLRIFGFFFPVPRVSSLHRFRDSRFRFKKIP